MLSSRSSAIKNVQKSIQKRYGNRYQVECFGSTRYNVDNAGSDLDLVIVVGFD